MSHLQFNLVEFRKGPLSLPVLKVVIRPPQPTVRESRRGLTSALREGAFAVLDRPLKLETMLETMRRVVQRHYQDLWPAH